MKNPINFHVLIFLKPKDDYRDAYFNAWDVLQPGPKSTGESRAFETIYSGRISPYTDRVYWTDAADLTLGKARIATNNGQQTPYFINDSVEINKDQVGINNKSTYKLGCEFLLNGSGVVRTNTTPEDALPNDGTQLFELLPKIYLVSGLRPSQTFTYRTEAYTEMQEFDFNPSDKEVLFEWYEENNKYLFKKLSADEFSRLELEGNKYWSQVLTA